MRTKSTSNFALFANLLALLLLAGCASLKPPSPDEKLHADLEQQRKDREWLRTPSGALVKSFAPFLQFVTCLNR